MKKLDESWRQSKAKKKTATAQAADFLNRTVPNLSSIVVLAEGDIGKGEKKRLLLTGDAGGDRIEDALKSTKLSNKGKLHVDLLKVQHHGSNHSVDLNFFQNITADHYVISGNGKHGIPHPDTLGWLAKESPRGQGPPLKNQLLSLEDSVKLCELAQAGLLVEKQCKQSIAEAVT